MPDRLQMLTVGEVREEIAVAAGIDPARFGAGSQKRFRQAELVRIGTQLQPDESDLILEEMELSALYEHICEWTGTDYDHTNGFDWGLPKANLKPIHRALGATDPRAVVDPEPEIATDGGVDQSGTWHSGPVDPGELKEYFEWLLENHDGQLVESPIGGDYYVEVTRLEEDGDETLRSVEGARIMEADRDD